MQSLVMRPVHVCMICHSYDVNSHELLSGCYTWGLIYCTFCLQAGKVKEYFLKSMQDLEPIPCLFLLKRDLTLHFFRESKNEVVEAKVLPSEENFPVAFIRESNDIKLLLHFDKNFGFYKHVSVVNIMKHSPEFYQTITSCSNLFEAESFVGTDGKAPNDVVISYNELPLQFRTEFENCKKKAEL